MTPAKPYAGILSTGQRYLIGTTTADSGMNRFPLTIALSRPGEKLFSRVFRIRDRSRPGATGNHQNARLAYPYAVEYDRTLYVIYSAGRRPANQNDAELAVIPVENLWEFIPSWKRDHIVTPIESPPRQPQPPPPPQ